MTIILSIFDAGGCSKCRRMHQFILWLPKEKTGCICQHFKACSGCLLLEKESEQGETFLILQNWHVMIILLTFDLWSLPVTIDASKLLFDIWREDLVQQVTFFQQGVYCWSYWTSFWASRWDLPHVVKLALDDYFVDYHQWVITTSDNWCIGSSLWPVKKRFGAHQLAFQIMKGSSWMSLNKVAIVRIHQVIK